MIKRLRVPILLLALLSFFSLSVLNQVLQGGASLIKTAKQLEKSLAVLSRAKLN